MFALARKQSGDKRRREKPKMLLLRGARAASAWAASTAVAAGASGCRYISIRLAPVAALSSGGRKRKGQRRGEAKPPSPPPPPQPLPRQSETPSSKKKSGARPSGEAKKSRPVELGEARGPRRLEGGEARKGNTQQQLQEKAKVKRLVRWKCASGCGACCKLDKGPDFPTPDEIFADHQDDLQVAPFTTCSVLQYQGTKGAFLDKKNAILRLIRV